MTIRLADRLTRLEQTAGPAGLALIIRRLVSPNEIGREIRTLRHGEKRWERQKGETEKAFIGRVEVYVQRHSDAVTRLIGE